MTEPAEKRPKAIGVGRSGRVRTALARVLAEAREAGRMTLEHELRAIVAERTAALCDDYAAQARGADMLKASATLLELLDTLPVRDITREEGPTGDSGSERGKLLSIMDRPPTVGDSAHS